jgi:hypothetical protein
MERSGDDGFLFGGRKTKQCCFHRPVLAMTKFFDYKDMGNQFRNAIAQL